MIGDRGVSIASFKAGIGNLLDRRSTIAPFGVHLQIAAVPLQAGAIEGGIREDTPHFRAAEELPAKLTPPLNVGATLAPFDGLFDGRRSAGLQDLADHARRSRPDAGIRGRAPSGPSKSVNGVSSERMAAAARL